ncbi:MAG: reverse transcriptase/maturase family protein [Planctomycetota bacterium]
MVSFDNILKASHLAARGKSRRSGAVARFLVDAETEAFELERELRDGTYRPGPLFEFTIFDPKVRKISAAPFRDRVVHHCMMSVLAPIFERRMVFESFACRKRKGQHAALFYAQKQLRRHEFFIKLDIRQFFASLDHRVVLESLYRCVKDHRVGQLMEVIVRHPQSHGLPLGNLTSQWLANLTLDRLDHFVKEQLRVRGYLRYMDDFVLFGDDRQQLRRAEQQLERFLVEVLGLQIKSAATVRGPSSGGLPFLGWMVYPRLMRLRRDSIQRSKNRLREQAYRRVRGEISEETFVSAVRSVLAHLDAGGAQGLRRRLFLDWVEVPGAP